MLRVLFDEGGIVERWTDFGGIAVAIKNLQWIGKEPFSRYRTILT